MKRTQVYLTQEQIDSLKNLANERVNFSEHVRRAVDKYLASQESEPANIITNKSQHTVKAQS